MLFILYIIIRASAITNFYFRIIGSYNIDNFLDDTTTILKDKFYFAGFVYLSLDTAFCKQDYASFSCTYVYI